MIVNEGVVVEHIRQDEAIVINRLRLSPGDRIVLDLNQGALSARFDGTVRSCRPALEDGTYTCDVELATSLGEDDGWDSSTERRSWPCAPFAVDGPALLHANLQRSVPIQVLNVSQAGCLLACRDRVTARVTGELHVKAGEQTCRDAAYVVRCEPAGGTRWPFVVGVELLATRRAGPGTLRSVIGTAAGKGGWL